VSYWNYRLRLVLKEEVINTEAVALIVTQLKEAHTIAQQLEIVSTENENMLLYAEAVQALLGTDSIALDHVLKRYGERHDKRSDAALCMIIASLARHQSPAWFTTVLERWQALAATKPGYFSIVWNCVRHKAISQALVAGAFAAEHQGDDPLFVEEFNYLQRVLAGGSEPH
jgi:hypothetical protein